MKALSVLGAVLLSASTLNAQYWHQMELDADTVVIKHYFFAVIGNGAPCPSPEYDIHINEDTVFIEAHYNFIGGQGYAGCARTDTLRIARNELERCSIDFTQWMSWATGPYEQYHAVDDHCILNIDDEAGRSLAAPYPNPCFDLLNIRMVPGASIEITDQLGRIVLSDSFARSQEKSLDVSSLNPGMYQVILRNKDESKTFKIMKLDRK